MPRRSCLLGTPLTRTLTQGQGTRKGQRRRHQTRVHPHQGLHVSCHPLLPLPLMSTPTHRPSPWGCRTRPADPPALVSSIPMTKSTSSRRMSTSMLSRTARCRRSDQANKTFPSTEKVFNSYRRSLEASQIMNGDRNESSKERNLLTIAGWWPSDHPFR